MSGASEASAAATRHLRLRWVGIALFLVALAVAAARIVWVVRGDLPPLRGLLPCVAALGFSLGSFGTANDTALHALRELAAAGPLPAPWAAELAHERRVRPDRLAAAHASPRMALALPVVTAGLLTWLAVGPLLGRPS